MPSAWRDVLLVLDTRIADHLRRVGRLYPETWD
jgi:hypothetical protein